MRKENIDHFFKYGTFPYGEWFEGSKGKLESCRSPRHCRYSTPSSSRDGGVQ
jgi:hypothetical protein